ncbi:hypothetical protein [Subtercola frigoramans]|uniref:Uncharacterized protein n=1 Tax=Subtercola frigoramans TaxID=120298 RepID=A0ABS2L7Q6_9MICO|nr:hypothetical protein [Subtercola frigoramans]MBM7473133.1 hypothetical protein [Subtercola frigoramans]
MSAMPSGTFALPPVDDLQTLAFELRKDHFELIDGLFPLEVVAHVMAAIIALEAIVQILRAQGWPEESASESKA